ncbi:TetR family transcriptional regulator [Ornithinibacillus sp. BX22]|uniref:TetR family transcriptional regulator n=2 Tax=Ornithinibacillus TaxID=484508 RepID=A0A923L5G1_9BACI|nr:MULTISPECIES: TetR family transcriptional regulator C-terminal domain-containing protein [Ornithinibacillus]MBC5636822.1 TetR family transcriptional regulator [Ornithinibacillus hominis]MBS3681388.1 TetR family transcriptional regulator [Ornithinibacillus massiliensis]
MPKIIDHHKRKVRIAEATWKVIVDEGIEQASVRKIAKAAGLSTGSLRHYFSSQSELLRFSMEMVSERVIERAKAREYSEDISPLEFLTEGVYEVLPVNEERKIEMEVWLAFSAKVLVDSTLRELSNKVYSDMHQGLKNVVLALQSLQYAKDGLDLELEANRLHAIVDGMAMHHLLNPEHFTHDEMIQTLKYHLQSLCK